MLKGMKYRYCVYELGYSSHQEPQFLESFEHESQATELAMGGRRICIDSETMEVCV